MFKKNNQAKLLLIPKIIYNNTKSISTRYIFFKLNYDNYLCVLHEKNVDSYF